MLLKFICSCTCTRTIAGQQQHETVTATTTTTQSNLHKLLSVQELIFPIQQVNMNTSSEKLILLCTCCLIFGGDIWSQHSLHLKSWPSWSLHLKTWPNSALCHEMSLPGGISVHFIWQVDLVVHFIWKLSLNPLFATRCHSLGDISESVHFIWKYELISGLGLASWRSFLQKTNDDDRKWAF